MIDYKKVELLCECLEQYKDTYAGLLDTADYIPQSSLDNICNFIDKSMRQSFKELKRESKRYKKTLKRLLKAGVIVDTASLEVVLDDYQDMLRFSLPDALEIMGVAKPSVASAPDNKPAPTDTVATTDAQLTAQQTNTEEARNVEENK